MSPNCQPNDLARIVLLPRPLAAANDRIVKLKNLPAVVVQGEVCWRLESTLRIEVAGDDTTFPAPRGPLQLMAGDVLIADYLPDNNLRPIRDPGDDAVDETLERVGAPVVEQPA